MVKEKSTTHVSLTLVKALLDISDMTHSNLIFNFSNFDIGNALVNKYLKLLLEQIF